MSKNQSDHSASEHGHAHGEHRAWQPSEPLHARWMTIWLKVAGIYNVLWGAWVILFPLHLFDLLGVKPPDALGLALWQCVGMIVGVYGVGYWVAARAPLRHWPIVLVGFLGKILGPIGFVDAALIRKAFPIEFGYTILTNDLVWWVPFGLMLVAARKAYLARSRAPGRL